MPFSWPYLFDKGLHAEGNDAEAAAEAITDLINRRFDEEE